MPAGAAATPQGPPAAWWSRPAAELLAALGSGEHGLASDEAARRLAVHGRNTLQARRAGGIGAALLNQFRSPLLLILIVAALVALALREWLDAGLVLVVLVASALLSAWQEHRASRAVEALRRRVSPRATVVRDGVAHEIDAEEVVPGDVLRLSAGSLVAADARLLESRDLFVGQGLLTGETFPMEKQAGTVPAGTPLAARANSVFMGTSVRSGSATALVVATARHSEFGRIAHRLALRPPETSFEAGLRQFGGLLLRVMLVVIVAVLAVHLLLQRPPVETLLFALALAVGLSPELLPAILSILLAHGARRMARHGVIVRRLNAIENLGAMDVLCTDKTGTLTRGVVELDDACDAGGAPSAEVLRLAALNSHFETGLVNPLDAVIEARAAADGIDLAGMRKLDEIPYDFLRKRLSIVVAGDAGAAPLMITKGALQGLLDVCDRVQDGPGEVPLDAARRAALLERFGRWSAEGYRVLGVAWRQLAPARAWRREDETGLVFAGFLLFLDPPEPQAIRTLRALRRMGVRVKIITGDNRWVARHVAAALGIGTRRIVTGDELDAMKDEALWHLAPRVTLFAEVDPNQKERIIRALQKNGHVVGYLGDGINDAPALQAADVGISVEQAVDVAKEAADFVLLRHDLAVLRRGIDEGRHTFANTLKYIFVTTSANFGNMLSMALASLVLPFLPLLARQILLNNFLSDIPAMGIAGDNVDREWSRTPHRWDLAAVRRFMIGFGLVSSAFDLLTFGLLLAWAGGAAELFRTGWFVESLLTELVIIFVVRTYKPFHRSRPGRFVLVSALMVGALTLALPYLPLGAAFGLVPLPLPLLALLLAITALYAWASELTKRRLFRRIDLRRPQPHAGAARSAGGRRPSGTGAPIAGPGSAHR